jgi:hypothetical protein
MRNGPGLGETVAPQKWCGVKEKVDTHWPWASGRKEEKRDGLMCPCASEKFSWPRTGSSAISGVDSRFSTGAVSESTWGHIQGAWFYHAVFCQMNESPFTDLTPRGPDVVFTPAQIDELIRTLEAVRATAVAA